MSKKQISYTSPTKGPLSYLPLTWVPYAELMRLDKPIGILYVYLPYLYGSLFAAVLKVSTPFDNRLLGTNLVLLVLAFIVRSVGCTWNDVVDRDLDRQVARCRTRPLVRGAITPTQAYIFVLAQYAVLFAVAVPFSPKTLPYFIPVISTGTFYPYAKRLTNYPQLVLGVSLSSAMLVGSAAMDIDPMNLGNSKHALALLTFASSYVVWTAVCDAIYSFQDRQEDERAGIKAISVAHKTDMKSMLFKFCIVQAGFLISTGVLLEAGSVYFLGTAVTAALVGRMLWGLDLDDPKSCLWWFKYGSLMVGGSLTMGLGGE
jgi:4-hydroxybenzoate polyprenyltransferase